MAISDELTRIQSAKANIKASIEAKGVTVPSDALIDTYDTYIGQISGGGGGQAEEDLKNLIERDITSITIPSGVTSIGERVFQNCTGLTSVTIPSSVTSIGQYAFNGCSVLTDITIPDSVTSIDNYVFSGCRALTSITIPSNVTSIGASAFTNCTSLTSVTIPSSVTSIGSFAFSHCTGLTEITVNATTPPTLGPSNVFNNTNNCPIYVPGESLETYRAATNWSTYADRIKGYTYTSYDYGVVPTGESLGIRFSYQDIAESLPGGVETATVGFTDGTNTFQVLLDAVNGTLLVDRMIDNHSYQKTYTLAEGETYTLMFDVPMYFDDTISEGLPWTMEVAEIDA